MTRILATLTLLSALWPRIETWLRPRVTTYVLRGFINDNHAADMADTRTDMT